MHQKRITAGRGSAQSGNYSSSELLKLETTERDTREILDRLAAIKAEAQIGKRTYTKTPYTYCSTASACYKVLRKKAKARK